MASASSVLLSPHVRTVAILSQMSPPHPQLRVSPPVLSSISPSRFVTLALSTACPYPHHLGRLCAAAPQASIAAESDSSSEASRRLYVGNIPRTVDNAELASIVAEHGTVEKSEVIYDKYSGRSRRFAFVTMKTVDDAVAVVEKLNGTQIGGREIKVNVTEKPLNLVDLSLLQAEESQFIDSPHKVYVGNLAKSITTEKLKEFFSQNGNVLSAKVSRIPGTSKSTGFGFVTFSSAEEVEAAISSCNNVMMGGQNIRVNKA